MLYLKHIAIKKPPVSHTCVLTSLPPPPLLVVVQML